MPVALIARFWTQKALSALGSTQMARQCLMIRSADQPYTSVLLRRPHYRSKNCETSWTAMKSRTSRSKVLYKQVNALNVAV